MDLTHSSTSKSTSTGDEPIQNDVTTISLNETERLSGRENFDFYCFLIWPFIEATWLGAISLLTLTPPSTNTNTNSSSSSSSATTPVTTQPQDTQSSAEPWLDLKKVQSAAQLLGKTLYHQGDLSYFEAVNKETLKNSYTRFLEENMIVVSKKRGGGIETVRLGEGWVPPTTTTAVTSSGSSRDGENSDNVLTSTTDGAGMGIRMGEVEAEGRLWEFCERISQSRREGKNRRDGETVKRRVLGLVEMVRRPLWEGNKVDGVGSGGGGKAEILAGDKAKRRRGMQNSARL